MFLTNIDDIFQLSQMLSCPGLYCLPVFVLSEVYPDFIEFSYYVAKYNNLVSNYEDLENCKWLL
jgi:hypothetical protein